MNVLELPLDGRPITLCIAAHSRLQNLSTNGETLYSSDLVFASRRAAGKQQFSCLRHRDLLGE